VPGEARVERPVRVVAGDREVDIAGTVAGGADRNDLAVRLDRHSGRPAAAPDAEGGRLLAVAGEARVERPVGVVAGEREVVAEGAAKADSDNLAVRLERHTGCPVVA